MNKKQLPLKILNPITKAEEKYYKIIKKQTDSWNWNDWKFQIDWNMLEWVNPGNICSKKTCPYSSKKYYIDQDDRISLDWPFKTENI